MMATNGTVLCIHRDPTQLGVLQEHGYDVVTATNGSDGLRLFMSRPVDAIVLEYHLGLLDGSTIADTIKKVHPDIPVVMLTDHLELPDGALKSVDALVTKSDGAHFLWATVHFVLNVKPAQRLEEKLRPQMPVHLRPHSRQRAVSAQLQANLPELAPDSNDAPFSPAVWRSIWDGDIQF